MQVPINFRVPSTVRHWITNASGTVIFNEFINTSSRFILRTQTGYNGPRPTVKPYPPHNYDFNQQDISLDWTADYRYRDGRREQAVGPALGTSIQGATFIPAYDGTALTNKVLSKLADKVRGDLDVSIDLAEARKTAKMLKVQDQLIDYSKTFVRRFGPVKAASKAWLTYQYGIRPLVKTIFGLADENVRVVINRSSKYRATASDKFYPTHIHMNGYQGGANNFPVVKGQFVKVSTTFGVDMRTDQFDLSRFSSLNPVSIAWELTPFSFVVDWFYNLGGYLRTLETGVLYANKFRSGYRTDLTTGTIYCEILASGSDATIASYTSIWKGKLVVTNIQRRVLSSYPLPRLPVLQASLGSSRLISGAALLAQVLNGRRT